MTTTEDKFNRIKKRPISSTPTFHLYKQRERSAWANAKWLESELKAICVTQSLESLNDTTWRYQRFGLVCRLGRLGSWWSTDDRSRYRYFLPYGMDVDISMVIESSITLGRKRGKKKTALLSIEYWLFNRDPYNGLCYNPHTAGKDFIP